MSINVAKPEHEVAYQDLVSLVNKHRDEMNSIEILAIASNMLGKLIAIQDQRIPHDLVMKTVIENIEVGNQQIIQQLASETQGNA